MKTKRLELIAGTSDLLRAEISDREYFAQLLEARVHPAWAQERDYQEVMASMAQRLEDAPDETGWWGWYFGAPQQNDRPQNAHRQRRVQRATRR